MSGFGTIDSMASMAGMMMQAANNSFAAAARKLSSGLAVQNAGDGPAQLAASENLKKRIQGLDTAIQNNTNSANMIKTADAVWGRSTIRSRTLGLSPSRRLTRRIRRRAQPIRPRSIRR